MALLIGLAVQLAKPTWFQSVLQVRHADLLRTAATLVCAVFASVVLHEIGHLVPSLLLGFYVSRVSLGPVSVTRVQGYWKVNYSRSWLSASVSALPVGERGWRTRMLLVVAGGPFATLCLFVVAISVLNRIGPLAAAAEFIAALAQINLLLFFVGLLPNDRANSVRNDARLFLTLLENGVDAEQIKLYQQVTRLQILGVRPRSYPVDLIKSLAKLQGNYDLMLFNALTIYLWAIDSGHIGLADAWDRHANELLSSHSLRLADSVLGESAFFDLFYRDLPHSAIEKLQSVRRENLPEILKHRATATLEFARGDHEQALRIIDRARTTARTNVLQFESDLLDYMHRRVMVARSKTPGAYAAAA
jgi:hypothetical protein